MAAILDREEYIEQAYFFHVLRERLSENVPAQEVLERLHEEILSTTRLPYAIQFLATELKHAGLLSAGFARLLHYFTPYQAFVIQQTEEEGKRFNIQSALVILEREAAYRAAAVTKPGLFVYQFEAVSRNRLGYEAGLQAMFNDPMYDDAWRLSATGPPASRRRRFCRHHLRALRVIRQRPPPRTAGLRTAFATALWRERRQDRQGQPRPRSALSVLGTPAPARLSGGTATETPRGSGSQVRCARVHVRELETRIKVIDAELKGQVDVTQLLAKPELLKGPPGGEED